MKYKVFLFLLLLLKNVQREALPIQPHKNYPNIAIKTSYARTNIKKMYKYTPNLKSLFVGRKSVKKQSIHFR